MSESITYIKVTFLALSSLGVGLVIFSELSATVMIGGVLIIKKIVHLTLNYSDPKSKYCLWYAICYLIVLIEAEFAFIDSVVVALTGMAKLTEVHYQSLFDFMEN